MVALRRMCGGCDCDVVGGVHCAAIGGGCIVCCCGICPVGGVGVGDGDGDGGGGGGDFIGLAFLVVMFVLLCWWCRFDGDFL